MAPSPTVQNHTRLFRETRNRQIGLLAIICLFVGDFVILYLSALIGRLWCFTVKLSSLQFIKFIASLLFGNLSPCFAVVSKSAKDHRHLAVDLFVYLSISQQHAEPILMKLGKRAGYGKRKHLHYIRIRFR